MNAVLGLNSIGLAHNDLNMTNVMIERKQSRNNADSYLCVTLVDLGNATILSVSFRNRPPVCQAVACVVFECLRGQPGPMPVCWGFSRVGVFLTRAETTSTAAIIELERVPSVKRGCVLCRGMGPEMCRPFPSGSVDFAV